PHGRMAFSPDNRFAVAACWSGLIYLWRLPDPHATGKPSSGAQHGAFLLLGGKGVEVGKFDTLAEAVKRAGDGDTIEIRANGPFSIDPIDLGAKALIIRAGAGYVPVIRPSPAAVKSNEPLLKTNSSITLEGLELYHEGSPEPARFRRLIYSE